MFLSAHMWESITNARICRTFVEWACETYDIPKPPELKSFRIVIRENPKGEWQTDWGVPRLRNIDNGMVGYYWRVGFDFLPYDTRYDLWIEYEV